MSIGLGDRLHQVRTEKEQLERDYSQIKLGIDDAKSVQETLISIPVIKELDIAVHSEAPEFLGGDWYGLFQSESGSRVYLGIGDVTGHSLSSSLVTGAVAGAFHYGVQELDEYESDLPSSLIHLARNLNEVILRGGQQGGKMMTMGFFALDLRTKEYAYLSAGHLPMFVIGKKVKPKISIGSPLGLVHSPVYKPVVAKLEKDETLFFFTDGLIENTGPNGKCLGQKELMHHLAGDNTPQKVIARIKQRTNQMWTDGNGEDDSTFLAIKNAS